MQMHEGTEEATSILSPFMVHMLESTCLLVWLALTYITKGYSTCEILHEGMKVNQPSNRLAQTSNPTFKESGGT